MDLSFGLPTVSAMDAAFAVSGILILVFVMHDVVKTTLGQHGGYLTTWITATLWRAATRLSRYGRHTMLYVAGVTAVILIIAFWMGLIWLGWTLIFSGARDAILGPGGWPASFGERIQYAGYAIVTLGTPAGHEPSSNLWRAATVLAAINGFSVLTMGVAYLTPLISAATEKRQLALYISSLGESADEILVRSFDGEGCASLEAHLEQLAPMLVLLAQRYRTYPALHYFHATDRSSAATPNLAALDEALTLLQTGCAEAQRPAPFPLGVARRAITAVLGTLERAFVQPADEVPPPPSLGALRKAGFQTADDETFAAAMEEHEMRRRLLLALVKSDGWDWNAVHHDDAESDGEAGPMTEVSALDVPPH